MTVFKGVGRGTESQIFIAFRGTGQQSLSTTPNDLQSAGENLTTGAAISQIVAMFNWWQRVSTPAGVDVTQFSVPTDRNEAVRVADVKSTGEVAELLNAASTAKVTVTGSSLGGHLAMAFATLFPQYTQQAVAFNAPGFGDQPALATLFQTLGGSVPVAGNPLITNVVSSEANNAGDRLDLLAGYPLGSYPGTLLTIPIENQFFSDVPDPKVPSWNHDQRQITDALTVFDMLQRLDPSLTLERFGALLRASAEGENRSLENLVDAVESLLGINTLALPAGNARRDALHAAVQALVGGSPQSPQAHAQFASLTGQVEIHLFDVGASAAARSEFGALVALQELSPFWISGMGAAGQAALDQVWQLTRPDDYQAWRLEGVSAASTRFTDTWVHDRAALLNAWVLQNTDNLDTGQIVDPTVPQDRTYAFSFIGGEIPDDQTQPARHTLFAQRQSGQPPQVIFFGSDGNDVATGNGNSLGDHLYGGAGNDILNGLAGNDYLEGGRNYDTYAFDAGFGHDTVFDIDGDGVLVIDGQALDGGRAGGTYNVWHGQDRAGNLFLYTVRENRQSSTGNELVVTRHNDSLNSVTVAHFDLAAARGAQGYLGIRLDDTQQLVLAHAPAVAQGSPFQGADLESGTTLAASNALAAGGAGLYTVFLRAAARAGDTLTLSLTAHASALRVFLDGAWVAADGAIVPLWSGQREVSFALLHIGDAAPGASTQLLVQYAESGTGSVTASNAWTVNLEPAGTGARAIDGDQSYQLHTSATAIWRDGRIVVAQGGEAFTVGADGNLAVGEGMVVVHNVLYGGAYDDLLHGLSGNDALDGGAGHDLLRGGDGDDLLAGGAGDNTLEGGAGNDFILAAGMLSANLQQLGPHDTWLAPSGRPVLGRGATWGVYQEATDLVVWAGAVGAGSGSGANTVLAGDGDDHVIGGPGDDRVDGGAGHDRLDGMAGADIIDGGDGNDVIRADGIVLPGYLNTNPADSHGRDFVDAGAGDDLVEGGGHADTLYGGMGNDRLFGDNGGRTDDAFFVPLQWHGADLLDGGPGDDYLEGGGGNDTLYGGDGADMLWGDTLAANLVGNNNGQSAADLALLAFGDDYLDGGAGDDSLVGGGGSDVLRGGEGRDSLWGDESSNALAGMHHGADTLDGGAGDDILLGGGGGDVLLGDEGADHLMGDDLLAILGAVYHGDDYLDGGAGADRLVGGGGADTLFGGTGNDTLVGDTDDNDRDGDGQLLASAFAGDDYLDGEAGDDHLLGGGGNDTLIGGAGHDTLDGGPGADHMVGGPGDDVYLVDDIGDVVIESHAAGTDHVYSAVDFALPGHVEHLTLTGAGDLAATGNHHANRLTGGAGANRIRGGGGNDTLVGGAGADTLIGGAGDDQYDVDDAGDVVVEEAGQGVDLVRTHVHFTLGAHVEQLVAIGTAHLQLGGNALDNDLFGNAGHNVLTGGRGNDYLRGGPGNDVYVFDRGDGHDTIDNTDFLRDSSDTSVQAAVDTLRFGAGIASTDVIGWQDGEDLVLRIRGAADGVTVLGHFSADEAHGSVWTDRAIDRVAFTDGGVWDRSVIQSVVDRAASNRAPIPSGSLPTLQARATSPFFHVFAADTMVDPDAGDLLSYTVRLPDGSALPAWLAFDPATRTLSGLPDEAQAGDLHLVLWGTDGYGLSAGVGVQLNILPGNRAPVLVTPFPDATAMLHGYLYYHVDYRNFSDPDTLDMPALHVTLEDGGALPAWMHFDQSTRVLGGVPAEAGSLALRITATDAGQLSASDVVVITVVDPNPAVVLVGTAGNDVLIASERNNRFEAGPGSDDLYGSGYQDTYRFNLGDGLDFITEKEASSVWGASDALVFGPGIRPEDIRVFRQDNTLVFQHVNGTDQVVVNTWFTRAPLFSTTAHRIENILFADGTAWNSVDLTAAALVVDGTPGQDYLSGSDGDDTLRGLGGDDTLAGSWGHNVLDGGDGNDTLYADTGHFTTVTTSGAGVYVREYWASSVLLGGPGDDNLFAYSQTRGTVFDGGPGNDNLRGSAYNDSYRFNLGDGHDTLIEELGQPGFADQLAFGEGIAPGNVRAVRRTHDLVLGYGDGADRITLKNWFASPDYQIESIGFFDGTQWSPADVAAALAPAVVGTSAAETLAGAARADYIAGFEGNDLLRGLDGDDWLDGGAGNDTLQGGAGSDWLFGDAAHEAAPLEPISSLVVFARGSICEDVWPTMEVWLAGTRVQSFQVGHADFRAYTVTLPPGLRAGSVDIVFSNDAVRLDLGQDRNLYVDRIEVNGRTLSARGAGAVLDFGVGAAAFDGLNTTVAQGTLSSRGAIRIGLGGNDHLDGGTGADFMAGGFGNDVYIVDNRGDRIEEHANAGHDVVRASVDYTLSDHLEDLELTGTQAIHATGNAGSNTLRGNAAANRLDGGAGADMLVGGAGDDTYVVDHPGDAVYEVANAGIDTVHSSVTFALGAHLENLTLTGSVAINGTGNSLDNQLTGNSAANLLNGGAGDDTLAGGAGNDKLYGGAGSDLLTGDAAHETAAPETIHSLVVHARGTVCEGVWPTMEIWLAGVRVQSFQVEQTSFAAYTVTVPPGTSAGSVDIAFTNDAVRPDLGQDRNLYVDRIEVNGRTLSASDTGAVLDFGAGAAAFDGLNTTLARGSLTSRGAIRIGLGGNDYLDGGAGADTLAGGHGNDVYIVDDNGDRIEEHADAGHDIVRASVGYTLSDHLEDLELTGTQAIHATGNAGSNTLRGNAAANRLDGGAGADMLVGGAGGDTYVFGRGHGQDTVYENDATPGNTDIAWFGLDVAAEQLWFRRSGSNLDVSIIGSTDRLSISGWYSGAQHRVEQFVTSDGRTLLEGQVHNLVNAMAAFAPPALGQTSLSTAYAQQLAPVIAANWQ